MNPTNVGRNLLINPEPAPFNDPELRRAMGLALDRKAFIDIITEGKGNIGGIMLPPPEGIWGMPAEVLQTLPGYGPDVQKNRAEARAIMQKLGYGPDKRIRIKLSTRDIPPYRDPAVILIDQLKQVYIDAELEPIDTTQWYPRVMRKDFTVALNLAGNGIDDPDQAFYENYVCGAEGNYNGYCNPEIDKLVDLQSMQSDQGKRRELLRSQLRVRLVIPGQHQAGRLDRLHEVAVAAIGEAGRVEVPAERVEHLRARLRVVGQRFRPGVEPGRAAGRHRTDATDRLRQHGRLHPLGVVLQHVQDERAADALAVEMVAVDAQV